MFSKLRILGLVHVPKNKVFGPFRFRYLLVNPLCAKAEPGEAVDSPELPRWAEFKPASRTEDDDDFVIPSLANWVESRRLGDPCKAVQQIFAETTESDADKISKVLKTMYPSPEDAARALDRISFDMSLSSAVVEQVLKRFSSDWVPGFGFFKWAKSQRGYEHSPEMYNFMVDILGKCKKFELMWELVEEMNCMRDFVSLATMTKVMRRLARFRMYKESIDAFRSLERYGVAKDISALNILMEALVLENSVEHANEVFLEFKESIPPNDHTFNILIHGWCKVRRLDNARNTMEEMERHGFRPDVYSYTCFVEAHSRDKDFRKVCAILDEMKEKGLKPSVVTYTIVMHGLGKAKQINEAVEIYEKMKESGCVADTSFYNSLIFILGKAGRLKDAQDLFEDMEKRGVKRDTVTYKTMITCACEHVEEETALKLLKRMEEEQSCRPSVETYAPLLKLCCKKRRMRVLYFLLDHMFSNGVSIEVGTYSLLITELCKIGKLERGCAFFEEMVSKGMVPMEKPYERLRKELEAKKMVEAKEKIESLMFKAKQQRDFISEVK